MDCFVSKIEEPLYDEPTIMWAHAYVALSTRTNTFFLIKHLSSNNNFGTCYLKIKYLISWMFQTCYMKEYNKKWKFIILQRKDVHEIFSTL